MGIVGRADVLLTTGFTETNVLPLAGKIIAAVKAGKISHFFLAGGCDAPGKAASTTANPPRTLVLSWMEQKAVAILMSLFSLGTRGIYLGPRQAIDEVAGH